MRRRLLVPLLAAALVGGVVPALASSPSQPRGEADAYDYGAYLKRPASQYPPSDIDGQLWKYSSKSACALYGQGDRQRCTPRTTLNESDPQELFNVTGASVDRAWELTTGRPDVVIGVVDSGIRWTDADAIRDLNNKFFLNTGELPEPQWGDRNPDHPYDRDANGQVDMRDWCPQWDDPKDCGGTGDPTVRGDAGTDDTDLNDNGFLDPEDLIFMFSDGIDDDGNGYADDIAGWDTYEDDNDPFDEHDYGHGTGEARDSTAEADNGGDVGTCPDCRVMNLRVGDSFVADVNDFAQAVVYATDAGVTLIQSALGTLNNSRFAQEAIDYAYRRGVVLVASAADESAGHHNQPSMLEHAMTFNAIGEPQTQGAPSASGSYLQFRGCTNYGAYVTAAVPGNSCSSEAVGRMAGMAGLAYAAARNGMDRDTFLDYGVLDGDGGVPAGTGLSAEEVKQLVVATADDINNVTPIDKTRDVDFPGVSERYPATEGWDPFFGYGRVNARSIVDAVTAGEVPPEADISSPTWFDTAPTTAPISVEGAVAARRAAGYDVRVLWAPWSWRDVNTAPDYRTDGVTLAHSGGSAPYDGVLATIDPQVVKAALDAADTSAPGLGRGTTGPAVDPVTGRGDHENRQLADKFGVIVRLEVTAKDAGGTAAQRADGSPLMGLATKNMNVHDDPTLVEGFPKDLLGDGAAAPRFADLDDDGKDELVVATSNGLVHAYRADGSELPGWPVGTTEAPSGHLPTARAYRSGEITVPVRSAVLRSPAIGDLDRDGDLEVVVADFAGRITAYDASGQVVPGFPVRTDPRWSTPQPDDRRAGWFASHPEELPGRYPRAGEALPNDPDLVPDLVDRRTKGNRTHWWALAAPTLGDIDPEAPGLEIVAGAGDRHVYAWHADGSPVEGWPVFLRDPAKTERVDPVTREVTQADGVTVFNGAKIVTSPAIGDLDGDGRLEVVVSPNEQYDEPPNTTDPLPTVSGVLLGGGNQRTYALHADGAAHEGPPGSDAHPNPSAYLSGWPVKVSSLALELLPVVGNGPTGAPTLGNVDDDPELEVAVFGTVGPIHLFNVDGTGALGQGPAQRLAGEPPYLADNTLSTVAAGALSNSKDLPSIPAAGGGVLADMDGLPGLEYAAPAAGLGKLLDLALPDDQIVSDNHLSVWRADASRAQLPAFPREVNDLQFLATPAVADIGGDPGQEILTGTAYSDLHAFNVLTGAEPGQRTLEPGGWPKFTGGWSVVAPAVGDLDGDGLREVASTTREGDLFAWRTTASSCAAAAWGEWGHDGWNTGLGTTDAARPAKIRDLIATPEGEALRLVFTAPGDDGSCGRAARYELRASDQPFTAGSFTSQGTDVALDPPAAAGTREQRSVRLPAGTRYLALRTADALESSAGQPVNVSALTILDLEPGKPGKEPKGPKGPKPKEPKDKEPKDKGPGGTGPGGTGDAPTERPLVQRMWHAALAWLRD